MADNLNRVFLWGVSRSVSAAITRSLTYVDGIQIINQPYMNAHLFGPDAESPELIWDDKIAMKIHEVFKHIRNESENSETPGVDDSLLTFPWIRDQLLEAPYPNKKALLCREQAWYLHGRYDMLPKGFKYSFLIRHPIKVLYSHKEYLTDCYGEFSDVRAMPPLLFPPGYGFKELYDLVEYVRENIDPHPTIMDADDLLTDPAGILSTYCSKMGLTYSSKLLSWEAGKDITKSWIMTKSNRVADVYLGIYKRASDSVGFDGPRPVPDLNSLEEDVQACVKFSMGYYESMYRERITATNV